MTNNIDSVIWNCERTYGLNVTEENKDKFIGFIKRQLRLHKDYDLNFRTSGKRNPYPYLNHLVNKLYLLSILIGKTSINAGYLDNIVERRIGWYSLGDAKTDGTIAHESEIKPKEERYKDLYLLRKAEIGYLGTE